MGRLFGTDGARGVAITELTCELAMQIGRAAAMVLTKETNHKAKIIIGKDTRISGDILESALVAGICSVGADAHILGVVPTPAVAMLVKKYNADAGVMISASHNSVEFNGIKLFSGTGFKLSDEIENEIEALILDTPEKIELKDGCDIGHVYYEKDAAWDYIRYVMKTVQTDFNGIRVALDCANGSASVCAQRIFEGLGAKCIMLNNKPDGTNINKDCGSTHIEGLQKAVVDNHCDIGLAFDGDADRCLAVDEKGELIDGDKILAIFSKYMKSMGILKNNTCVVTVMTNLGFFKYAKANGIDAATTNTGDGELTGTKLLTVLKCTGEKASELASCMECYPQVLVNVKITADKKGMWDKVPEITDAIKMYSEKLGDEGRILVRESGTEPLVRVMIEGKRTGIITEYAHKIAELIEKM